MLQMMRQRNAREEEEEVDRRRGGKGEERGRSVSRVDMLGMALLLRTLIMVILKMTTRKRKDRLGHQGPHFMIALT